MPTASPRATTSSVVAQLKQASPASRKDQIADLRRKLLANGYSPIPNWDKQTFMKDWPSIPVDEAAIDSWSRKFSRFEATGLRVENGLCVVDVDIDDELADDVVAIVEAACHRQELPLIRTSGGRKAALFVRCAEPFGCIHTRTFRKPGAGEEDPTHRVEVFGGASSRQFGSFGPHTKERDGTIRKTYEWEEGDSPENVPLVELPILTKDDIHQIVDIAEARLLEAGWEPELRSKKGENDGRDVVFDIEDGMTFELNDGTSCTTAELAERAGEPGLRCSLSWLIGPTARRLDRCLVGQDHAGRLQVWETADGILHKERSRAPVDRTPDLDRFREKLALIAEREAKRLKKGDGLSAATAKLLAGWAWCGGMMKPVVPILERGSSTMSMANFRTTMLPWSVVEEGPKGGEKRVNPADLWACSQDRVTVDDVVMRPDMPYPLFDENGARYVNTYDPPVHPAGGRVDEFLEFMEHLLPVPEERTWFLQWLGHKFRNPGVPGPGVVMVARGFGTGRGTLGEIMKLLFGSEYVATVPFSIFAGQNTQSQYQEWLEDSVMVVVNESSEVGESTSFRRKADVYEHLKETVEPRRTRKLIVRKGERSHHVWLSTSFLIATNNIDAIPIPEHDRRLAVLTNGDPAPYEFFSRLNAWMAVPANVGALARFLCAVDLAGYSPYEAPPKTAAKAMMSDMSASDLDRGFDLAVEAVAGRAMVVDQIVATMKKIREIYGLDYPERWETATKRIMQKRMHRIGVTHGANWLPMVGSKRYAAYARTRAEASDLTSSDASELRAEILRSGTLGAEGNIATLPMGGAVS